MNNGIEDVNILISLDSDFALPNIEYYLRNVLSKLLSKYDRNCLYILYETDKDLKLVLPVISEFMNNIDYMIHCRHIKLNKTCTAQKEEYEFDSIFDIADYYICCSLDIYDYDAYNEDDRIKTYNLLNCYNISDLVNKWSQKLSDEQKLIYNLRKKDRLTDEEISEKTGLSMEYICRKNVEISDEMSKCYLEYLKQEKRKGGMD